MADQNTIALIKALRERTGAGMMDCKHALEENNYDLEKSVDYLREKGIAKQAKRANRTAAEGLALVKVCDKCHKAALIEANCETDFVSASDKFHDYAEGLLEYVMKNEPASIEDARQATLQLHDDAALALGEKIEFRRYVILHAEEGQGLGSYIHQHGKIAVAVVLAKEDEDLAHKIAMHIAANAPEFVSLNDVPAATRDRELALAQREVADDEKLANKPQAVKDQIAVRKAEKALSQYCLLDQKYLIDPSKTIEQVLKEANNSVVRFVRYQVGEGLAA